MQVYKIDESGNYQGMGWIEENNEVDYKFTSIKPPDEFIKKVFDFEKNDWHEGATQEEIEAIKFQPTPLDPLTELGEQLSQEKLKNMQLNSQVRNLGQQLAMVKLDVMQIKGGQPL